MSNHTTESNKYHGKPCKKHGHTLRYKSNTKCVKCHKEYLRKWNEENKDKIISASRRYQRNNRDSVNKRNKAWRKNNKKRVKELAASYSKVYPQKYPQKHKAHIAVSSSIAKGTIPPASFLMCADGCEASAEEYHHESYDDMNLLNVIPLCKKCHAKRHRL